MSKFLKEMSMEASVRLSGYKREKEELLKATERISELDGLIAEAEAEIASFRDRLEEKEE